MAKKRKVSPLNFYGYREQLDFDPKGDASVGKAQQSDRDKGQDDRINELLKRINQLSEKMASEDKRIEKKTDQAIQKANEGIRKADEALAKIDAITARVEDLEDNVNELQEKSESAFCQVEYDSSQKKIFFRNYDGENVGELDAKPFIQDGMVDSVEYDEETKELVIVFNTDSGKEEIRVSLTDLFNLNAGSGITVNGNEISIKLDNSSEDTEKFASVSTDGFMLSGITEEIEKNAYAFWEKPNSGDDETLTVVRGMEGNEVIKVSKEGELFLMVEGELLSVNDLLGQIAHETY